MKYVLGPDRNRPIGGLTGRSGWGVAPVKVPQHIVRMWVPGTTTASYTVHRRRPGGRAFQASYAPGYGFSALPAVFLPRTDSYTNAPPPT